jgi:hypothetical protein
VGLALAHDLDHGGVHNRRVGDCQRVQRVPLERGERGGSNGARGMVRGGREQCFKKKFKKSAGC